MSHRLTRLLRPALLAASMSAGLCQSAMADNIFAYMKGTRQGVLQGEVTQKGHEGSTWVRSFDLGVDVPRDPATGQVTGRKRFKPATFLHDGTNKMAVQLAQALAINEVLADVTIQVFTPPMKAATGMGGEVLSMTLKFTNAALVGLNFHTVPTGPAPHPALAVPQLMQEVSFTYQRLEITDHQSGVITVYEPNNSQI